MHVHVGFYSEGGGTSSIVYECTASTSIVCIYLNILLKFTLISLIQSYVQRLIDLY